MLTSDIKIKRLEIQFGNDDRTNIGRVHNLLKDLREREFYQRLSIRCDMDWAHEVFGQITSIQYLKTKTWTDSLPLTDLRELAVDTPSENDSMVNSMKNIERIHIQFTSINKILPFIQRCPKLKQISICSLGDGPYFKNGIIDLITLNKERQKLADAQKITIFIREHRYRGYSFLENKWKQDINLSLIELRNGHLWKPFNPFDDYY